MRAVSTDAPSRRTAPERREEVIEAAIAVFAEHGYAAATTQQVAERAGISQAYVFRLFSSKRALFISCVETVMGRIGAAFADAAAAAGDRTANGLLMAMGRRYLELLEEPGLLALQLQSHAACGDPEIRTRVRALFVTLWEQVRATSGAPEERVREFFAKGMLINALGALGLTELIVLPADHGAEPPREEAG